MHNVFLDFLYFILSVSCVCHHQLQQTSAEIPISQQACGLGIKRSRSKKIHSSINVQSILSDDKVIYNAWGGFVKIDFMKVRNLQT